MKNIKSWRLFETENENKYFYDREKKRFQLCHPLLYYILNLSRSMDENEIKDRVDNLEMDNGWVEIENYGRFSKDEVDYYFQKFLLLKENGYFCELDQEKKLSGSIRALDVQKKLADINQVVFEVTDRCNLACDYCTYGKFYCDHDKREDNDMDFRPAKYLLDHLAALWNSPLNISHGRPIHISFYGGEPLLGMPFIEKVVEYVKGLETPHNHFIFSMTTNGILLQKHMDFLYENNFELLVSLDGDEQSNAYRVFKNGEAAYETIVKNVKAVQKKYPDYFSERVNFSSVLHNKNSASGIYRYFKEHFDKTSGINSLSASGIKESMKKEFWDTYVSVNQSLHESEDYSLIEKDMFFRLPNIRDAVKLLFFSNDFCFKDYNDLIYSSPEEKITPTATCTPFFLKIFLTVNGKILTCERIGQQYDLGQVTPEKVTIDCDKIAETYNHYYDIMREQCNVCYNAELCSQCIFKFDDFEHKKQRCRGFMTQEEHAKSLTSFINFMEQKPENFTNILKGIDID